ncbi:MAG: hypothetical protein A3H96_08785 [Acidobacteria bacterium RIFCSPLOWO2_02_FULL_67_36]|nr:MAG: hypothetical protein A3H96_08785 [Acidobacteria bacterium RIFCSPLOWO2_02_FULL_67_36]OFW21068.1 MAG: hypothetical protein A3G21_14195 [Acidobacteria bacterium RIFCSPLOWO2_12_FULL_66_21]
MFTALVGRSLARHRALIAGLTVVLSVMQILVVLAARNLQQDRMFAQIAALIPPFVQEALGGSMVLSFGGLVAFGFFHPVVMIALAVGAIYMASEPAGEVEHGLVDLIAARPVPRAWFITRSGLVSALTTTFVVAMMLAANRAATAWLAPAGLPLPGFSRMLRLALNLLVLSWTFGAASLAFAAHARRRLLIVGSLGLAYVFLFLLHFTAGLWAPARAFDRLSPFHYYAGLPIALGMKDPRADVLILLGTSAVLTVCAYIMYARRDL